MAHCCAPHCKSIRNADKTVSFHEVPADKSLRTKWLQTIHKNCFLHDRQFVCSRHFREEDFLPGLKIKKLKKGSVPSIFNDTRSDVPSFETQKHANKREILLETSENEFSKKFKSLDLDNSNADKNHERRIFEAGLLTNFVNSFETNANNRNIIQYDNTHWKQTEYSKVTTDKCLQTSLKLSTIRYNCKERRRLNKLLKSKNQEIHLLNKKISKMSKKLETFQGDIHFKNLKKIITLEDEGYGTNHTSLILSQIRNFDKGKPRWDEKTIRECVLLNSVSPKGYRILRERELLQLPSKTTLHRYIGPVSGEVGITTLVTKRLTEEANNLLPEERFVSLIIDEMAIKPQCIYDKKLDCFFGAKTKFDDNKDQRTLANRLLCFVLHGLSTAYTIPCAYYFTRQLTGKELYTITQQVLFAVERCGYSVVRIVTDNYKTNVSLFKNLSKGNMKEAIIHPLDSERQLFLSFDQNHIIKNIRSLFLEREMFDGKEIISSKYVKLLYRFQSRENVKAVRNLTIKHIEPSNFEKMNVARAVAIFSPPVVAALELLKDNSLVHPKATDFKAAGATITFLRNIYKWFSIHDVHNRHEHIHSRLTTKMHFFTSDDERLLWLEDYFLPYLNHLRESCFQNNPPFKFLSDETYEAIQLTTKSTVGCIRYLLHNGYHYVLTRHFNSDSIESFFSSLRQMSGANDMLDVRATIFSLEKILKTGVASSVCQQNPQICCTTEKHLSTSSTPATELPEDVVSLLDDYQGLI